MGDHARLVQKRTPDLAELVTDLFERLQNALGDAYDLERELARTVMSRLFVASEVSLSRQVVIKVLSPEVASEVSASRFKQEMAFSAQLQHPNILPVLTAGLTDDLMYYVMPYLSGESLRDRLTREGMLPLEDAVRILRELAEALAFAHTRGIVHRDVKPENILLEEGHAVLTDFGVARALLEAQVGESLTKSLTDPGTAIGTPGYMSPEQAAGEHDIDARADVYAIAVVGYEMLAGEPVFRGATPRAILAAHLMTEPTPIQELRTDTPPEFAAAIAKGLAKDPADRFQTATEFHAAVVSEERFRKIFNHANDAAFVLDPARDAILDANPRACRLLGYSREELLALPLSAVHPDEMPRFRAFAQTVMDEGSGWTDDLTCLTKAGQRVPAEISASTVEINGAPCVVAWVRDVRTRADETLRESEQRFRECVEQLGDAFYVLERDGRISDVSRQACEHSGYRREELLRMSVGELFDGLMPESFATIVLQTRGGPTVLCCSHRRKDGTSFPVEVRVALMTWETRERLLIVARDISELVRAEQRCRMLEDRLAQTQHGPFASKQVGQRTAQ